MQLNNFIDHTLLKANSTTPQIIKLCEEAIQYKFTAVCVNSTFLPLIVKKLKDTDVKACVVNSFPLGATSTAMKLEELKFNLKQNAQEVDTVINIAKVLESEWDYIEKELSAMVKLCHSKAKLKVILETCYLNEEQIVKSSQLCVNTGVHFVKTSTGFGTRGASIEDISIIKETVQNQCLIKASGGIKTTQDALAMIQAGANRIGTSSGIAISKG